MTVSDNQSNSENQSTLRGIAQGAKRVLKEPILKALLEHSHLTESQIETLLIDLVIEDNQDIHIPYDSKAAFRSKTGERSQGVSRGAFNRTLKQARRNVTRSLYTMLLLAYLGLFDYAIFRPFEEVATRIGDYRRIREVLSGKGNLSTEDLESYKTAERTILAALDELASPLILKSELSRRKS
ncbi:MAG: hypothetical protein ACTSU3_02465 [Candidatus Thorarchaeota archaeon]